MHHTTLNKPYSIYGRACGSIHTNKTTSHQKNSKLEVERLYCHIVTLTLFFFLGKLMRFLALPMKLRLSCQRVSTIIVHKFGHYPFMEFNLHKTLIPFVSKPWRTICVTLSSSAAPVKDFCKKSQPPRTIKFCSGKLNYIISLIPLQWSIYGQMTEKEKILTVQSR